MGEQFIPEEEFQRMIERYKRDMLRCRKGTRPDSGAPAPPEIAPERPPAAEACPEPPIEEAPPPGPVEEPSPPTLPEPEGPGAPVADIARGMLLVAVAMESGGPAEDALVIVSCLSTDGGEELCHIATTGPDGATERFALAANAASPGGGMSRGGYHIRVDKPGCFIFDVWGIPVYADAVAMQNAVLTPLPEGYAGPRVRQKAGGG